MTDEIDVAVVGAGPSGLAVAALLKRQGRQVTIFEGSQRPGGQAQSPLLGGVATNLGAHALYLGGSAFKVLKTLGIKPVGSPPPIAGARIWANGRLVPLPTSPVGIFSSPLLDWKEALAFSRLLVGFFASPRVQTAPNETVSAWLDRTCPSPNVRKLLQLFFRLTTYTNAPDVLGAAAACHQLHLGLKNVIYLPFANLVDALGQGADLRTGRAVRQVHPDGRLVFDEAELRARTIVIATPLRSAVKLFADDRLRAFAAAATPGRAACLDLVLNRLPDPKHRQALGFDTPVYAAVHRQTPEGIVIQTARYLTPGEDGSRARAGLEALLDALQPGWRAEVKAERFLPELTVTSAVPTPAGGFGVQLADHVYAAADWAAGGFLIDGGLDAALQVASAEAGSVRLAG